MRKLRNWVLILGWEVLFLLKSIPYLFNVSKRRGPDYIIIGASKSGTTFLYKQLAKHPKIRQSRMKEPRFFNRYYWLGLKYYRSYFPKRANSELSGEATTSYFYDLSVPIRIKKDFPEVKLILLLRNPILRAYSHFQMNNKDHGKTSFLEVLKEESNGKIRYHYLDSSSYMKNLNQWLEFFPRQQIMTIKSETLFERPQETINQVFRFLGLDDFRLGEFQKVNQNDYQVLSEKDYEAASSFFDEDMNTLRNFLGDEFNWN